MLYKTKTNKTYKTVDNHIILVGYYGKPIITNKYRIKIYYQSWEQFEKHLDTGLLKGRFEEVRI